MSSIFEDKQKNKTIFKKWLFGQESGYIKEVIDILLSQTKIESEFAGPFLQTMPLKSKSSKSSIPDVIKIGGLKLFSSEEKADT